MRARRRDAEILLQREVHHEAAQAAQLEARVFRRLADGRANFHDRLVQFRLDLAQHQLVFLQDLRDVGTQLARAGIDDLVFLFDANGERRRLHGSPQRGSTTKDARLEPLPAVTLTSGSLDSRVRQLSTYTP